MVFQWTDTRGITLFIVMGLAMFFDPVHARRGRRNVKDLNKVDEADTYVKRIKRSDIGTFGALRMQNQKLARDRQLTASGLPLYTNQARDKVEIRNKQAHLHEVLRQTLYNRK